MPNLFKLAIMQQLFFKQFKFLLSEPDRSASSFYISDAGTITREILPSDTSFFTAAELHKSWKAANSLKVRVKDKDGVFEPEPVFIISDRNFMPLDLFNQFTDEERKKIANLKQIAKAKHAAKRANVGIGEDDPRTKIFNLVTTWAWIIIALMVIAKMIGGCG